ncbi:MAG: hypothetical protein LQ350_003069 [Teloschistes chrysophthalmus]|nr:MAG: hypothetical protein LQ350_003069 [Niorma chrysophthalma]
MDNKPLTPPPSPTPFTTKNPFRPPTPRPNESTPPDAAVDDQQLQTRLAVRLRAYVAADQHQQQQQSPSVVDPSAYNQQQEAGFSSRYIELSVAEFEQVDRDKEAKE